METRVKEKKKMNEMVELVDEQNQKLEYIYSVIAREIKAAPGLVNKINAKMSTLEGIQLPPSNLDPDQKFKDLFIGYLSIQDEFPIEKV